MNHAASEARVQILTDGFTALLTEYGTLLERSHDLHVNFAEGGHDKYDDSDQPRCEKWWLKDDSPMRLAQLDRIRKAAECLSVQAVLSGEKCAWTQSLDTTGSVPPKLATTAPVSLPHQEQDFTTPGTPSNLNCPFTATSNGKLTAHAASVLSRYQTNASTTTRSIGSRGQHHLSVTSPVQTTAHSQNNEPGFSLEINSRPPVDLESSLQGSGAVCPIRFLDTNKPEDIANYFEKHKHELPKSHEVCVRRHQTNADRIRELDAKYGNLVSMVQGLGQKHVPMLPDKAEDREDDNLERVRDWARKVDKTDDRQVEVAADEERKSHFDRPMRDVRVGESPGRPWGIQVPAVVEVAILGRPNGQVETGQQASKPGAADAKPITQTCPFTKPSRRAVVSAVEGGAERTAEEDPNNTRPILLPNRKSDDGRSMIFNGPVLMGYSVEQTIAILQALAKTGT